MSLEELLDDLDSGGVANAEQDDGCVTGNAIAPKSALAASIVEQQTGSGAPGGIGIDQGTREPGIDLGVGFRGIEVAQGDLAVGPSEVQGPVSHARVVVFFHERQRRVAALRHAHDQINAGGFVGHQCDCAAQRTDGIQNGAGGVGQR